MKTTSLNEKTIKLNNVETLTLTQLKDLVNLLENGIEENEISLEYEIENFGFVEELKIEKDYLNENKMTVTKY